MGRFWHWLAKDSISLFTGVLALLTGILVFYNGRQIRLSRDEFNATQRPHLVIHSINFWTPELKDNPGEELVGARVIYANKGPRGAIVESVNYLFTHRTIPLDGGIYARKSASLPSGPIEGASHGWFNVFDDQMVKAADLMAGNGKHAGTFLIGRIVYHAPGGQKRELGFCRRLVIEPRRNTWEVHDNPEYEYSY